MHGSKKGADTVTVAPNTTKILPFYDAFTQPISIYL